MSQSRRVPGTPIKSLTRFPLGVKGARGSEVDVKKLIREERSPLPIALPADRTLMVEAGYGLMKPEFDAGFPQYRRISVLGRGSYGRVYLAKHRETGEEVAIKETVISDDETRDDFDSEVEVLTRLQAQGAPAFKASAVVGGYGLIVTEKLLPLSRYTSPPILRKALESLWKLHERGVFHNDAFVRNIMMRGDDVVFIDFGMSILFKEPVPAPLRYVDLVSICFGHMQQGIVRSWGSGFFQSGLPLKEVFSILETFLMDYGRFDIELLEWAFRSRVSNSWHPNGYPRFQEPPVPNSIYLYIDGLRVEKRESLTSPTSEKRLSKPKSPIRVWRNQSDQKGVLPPS